MPEIMWALLVHRRIHKGKIYYCAGISMNKRSSSKHNLKCDAKKADVMLYMYTRPVLFTNIIRLITSFFLLL